jgi:prepilin-type N-terminal cleavage/methylation domain-containing protein
MKKMDNKGFSLVELIIVIAIMAILVGVLAPQFVKYVEQSRESSDLQAIEEVKTAIETLVADYGAGGSATVVANGTNITYGLSTLTGPAASKDLADYGVSSATSQKSPKITAITWTYESFKWTCQCAGLSSPVSAGAYYDAYGNKI